VFTTSGPFLTEDGATVTVTQADTADFFECRLAHGSAKTRAG
jgi:hypothetical protein